MKLTTTKPKPSKTCMICNFVAGDITNTVNRSRNFILNRRPPYIAPEHYQVPDSKACREALEMVKACSPEFLLNHSLRSYAFGIAMAHKVKSKIDKEVFFLGSVMHDLGLTEKCMGTETFEVEGAREARAFCIHQGIEVDKADLIHEMVALHNSVGIAHKCDPEIALLHYGAGADIAGLWSHDLNKRTVEEVLAEYSDEGFKAGMIRLIEEQIAQKPNSYMATMVELGFLEKAAKAKW